MNRSFFSKTRYMIGVGSKKLGRTPVPKLPSSNPPPPPRGFTTVGSDPVRSNSRVYSDAVLSCYSLQTLFSVMRPFMNCLSLSHDILSFFFLIAILFTPSTPNRNQVRWNTCAGVRRCTPSSEVVQTEQSRGLFQNKMAEHCQHCTEIFFLSFPIGSENYS